MAYQYRISQDEMSRLYEAAKGRMDAHLEFTDEQKKIITKCPHFKSEKEALETAIKLIKKTHSDYQIWAKIEKGDDGIFRIQNWWIVTDDGKTKLAADYIGMALMYDDIRLSRIIDNNVTIDDIVAYW